MPAVLAAATCLAIAVALVVLHFFGLYAVLLFVAGSAFGKRRKTAAQGGSLRIAALIVAHDEERVIAESVRTLAAQDYGPSLYEVVVVADRCTDRTAERARGEGARVLERKDGSGGKAAAVAFGVRTLAGSGGFDAIAVLDADNRADPAFLAAIAARLEAGDRVVQGFVDAKNPGASWVAASSALGFWAIAALAQAPRERVGLSAPLMGTGFALRMDDARTFLESGESLTDDLELGARLAIAGVRVAYEPRARVVDEKPTELGTAVAQRERWMQGRWAVAEKYLPRLVGGSGSSADLGRRIRELDVAFQLLAPSLLFTGVATIVLALLLLGAERWLAGRDPSVFAVASLSLGALYYLVPSVGIAPFRPPLRVWLGYLVQPVYLSLSAPLALSGWLRRERRVWRRTPKGPR